LLISPEYIEQNKILHETKPQYGVSSERWAGEIERIAARMKAKSILDYGCGKALLSKELKRPIVNYDPAIPDYATPPEPADFVVCTDVLEHIEPECLEEVMDDLQRLTLQGCFLVIQTQAAKRHLPDGRNAHLIIEKPNWWIPKIIQRWEILYLETGLGAFKCLVGNFVDDCLGEKK